MRQARIVITPDYTWKRLMREIGARAGETFLIVGKGARARRLAGRLVREIPDAMRMPTFTTGSLAGEHAVIINPDGLGSPLSWGHESPGTAPTVQATRGCPGGCNHGVP